jgi:hypothetical protein
MKTRSCCSAIIVTMLIITSCTKEYQPISLHPKNNNYFLFRDKAVVLIGSTGHYGAVMNLDFDYVKYLDELASYGINITRTFSGIYVEPQGAFNISQNTMAPAQGKFICPWAGSSEPGYAGGVNNFDLTKWDTEYFARLKDFIAEAGKQYLIYINNSTAEKTGSLSSGLTPSEGIALPLDVPSGNYKYEWIDAVSGIRSPNEIKGHKGGIYIFRSSKVEKTLHC